MNLTVNKVDQLKGRIRLPASKSYSIRAWMIAGCGGTSRIKEPSNCDDAKVAMRAARALGAVITKSGDHQYSVRTGISQRKSRNIQVNESGTVLRFILPLLSLTDRQAEVQGRGTLVGRPNKHLNNTLRERGVKIRGTGTNEGVPIVIQGGRLQPGRIAIDGSMSSQFISALLIACPQLEDDSVLQIRGRKVVSEQYITMTNLILQRTGVTVQKKDKRAYHIKGHQVFKGLKNFHVPSDYGLAAFHCAAAALVPSNIILQGCLDDDYIQADGEIFPLLKKMGVKYTKSLKQISIQGPQLLKGGTFSLKNAPDLVPIMSVLALFC